MKWHKNPKLDVAILGIVLAIWIPMAWTGVISASIMAFIPFLATYPLNALVDLFAWIMMPMLLAVCCLWEEIEEAF